MAVMRGTHWLSEIKRRRVIPGLGLYLASAWLIVEIIDFLTERYLWSARLVDISVLGAALMLPAFVLLTYRHGAPGKDESSTVWKLAQAYRLSGQLAEARATIEAVQKRAEAQRALDGWRKADDNYAPAQRAGELMAQSAP